MQSPTNMVVGFVCLDSVTLMKMKVLENVTERERVEKVEGGGGEAVQVLNAPISLAVRLLFLPPTPSPCFLP